MKKRLSLLLVTILLLSMLPVSVFAVSEGDFSLVGGTVTVDGTADKVISIPVQLTSEMKVTAIEGIFSKKETESSKYLELTKLTPASGVVLGSYDTNSTTSGRICWADDVNFVGCQLTSGDAIWTAQYTVDKDTPSGTYHVQFALTDLCDESFESVLSSKTYTSEITVVNNSTSLATGYTASIAADNHEIDVGDTLYISVVVASQDQTNYAAAEIKLSYDASKLTYAEDKSTLNEAAVQADNGSLTLEDHGIDQTFGTGYTIAFTATAKGEATITMTSAAFSDKVNAQANDLIAATISNETVMVAVKKKHDVKLPEIFKGATSVEEGQNYYFFLADDASYYDYGTVTATMDGQSVTVIDNADGSYTIENVTGALEVTGTRTGRTYKVTVNGSAKDDVTLPDVQPQYGVNYEFQLPEISGYNVTLTGVAYDANGNKVPFQKKGNSITIAATDITGDFTITVDKTLIPPTTAVVSVEGNAAGDVTASATADPNADFTFTVNENVYYDYSVTATVNGESVAVTGKNGNYTIPSKVFKAGDTIVINVNKSVKTDSVLLTKYITLDGAQMWLITVSSEKLNEGVFTYKGNKMYWSEKYSAYCYLMISTEAAPAVSANDLAIIQGTADTVNYGMDVNISGKVDANDAQLVYNMYKAEYSDFTENVTVEKFLRADVNGDQTVNVTDATAIISALLKN